MRRAFLLALSICLMLLSGCKDTVQYEENFNQWKENYLSTETLELEAETSVSDDEGVCRYKLHYSRNGQEQCVEVLEPELIAKVTARITDKKTELVYDGAILDTGSTVAERLSPMMALPTYIEFLKDGHFESAWKESLDGVEMQVTELELPDGSKMTLWQNLDDMSPVLAAIRSGEQVAVKIEF